MFELLGDCSSPATSLLAVPWSSHGGQHWRAPTRCGHSRALPLQRGLDVVGQHDQRAPHSRARSHIGSPWRAAPGRSFGGSARGAPTSRLSAPRSFRSSMSTTASSRAAKWPSPRDIQSSSMHCRTTASGHHASPCPSPSSCRRSQAMSPRVRSARASLRSRRGVAASGEAAPPPGVTFGVWAAWDDRAGCREGRACTTPRTRRGPPADSRSQPASLGTAARFAAGSPRATPSYATTQAARLRLPSRTDSSGSRAGPRGP